MTSFACPGADLLCRQDTRWTHLDNGFNCTPHHQIHKLKSKNATMPKAGPSPNSPPKALARISVHFAALMARWSSRSYGYVITGWWVWKERHLMNLRDLLLETYREQDMWLCGKIQHISVQSHISSNLNSDTKLWTRSSSNGFVHATIQMKSFAANPWTVN